MIYFAFFVSSQMLLTVESTSIQFSEVWTRLNVLIRTRFSSLGERRFSGDALGASHFDDADSERWLEREKEYVEEFLLLCVRDDLEIAKKEKKKVKNKMRWSEISSNIYNEI